MDSLEVFVSFPSKVLGGAPTQARGKKGLSKGLTHLTQFFPQLVGGQFDVRLSLSPWESSLPLFAWVSKSIFLLYYCYF